MATPHLGRGNTPVPFIFNKFTLYSKTKPLFFHPIVFDSCNVHVARPKQSSHTGLFSLEISESKTKSDVESWRHLVGVIAVIFGVIVIVGAVLRYTPGKENTCGIIVLVFSLLSILTFGVISLVGLILGVIGAALALAKE